jgi:Tol biopolymer transport system component
MNPKQLSLRTSIILILALAIFAVSPTILHAQNTNPAEPGIPGLPELPPGIELPDDVKEQLKKALQGVKLPADTTKTKPTPPTTTPSPVPNSKPTATPQRTSRVTVPSPPASTAFKRVAVEKSLGTVGDVNFSKYNREKPNFWISPNGRRFAYLIDSGIVIDGKAYRYENSIRQKDQHVMNFQFSPDSKRTSYVIHQGMTQGEGQGETLVVDGVPEKIGWNFIANHNGGVFSNDSQHVAYTARRYAKGDVEYVLVIDGKEREVFLKSPSWNVSFSPDNKRVVWAEGVGDGYQMRETSIDGKTPRIDLKYGPANLLMNFFYGGEGQMGYIAKGDDGKKFVVYDGKEHPQQFKEIKQLVVSRDGKHLAYVGEPHNFRTVVVVDGVSSKVYGGLEADYLKDSLSLAPVGGRYAYGVKARGGAQAIIDGKEGKIYSNIAEFTFSPDGRWVAYLAAQGGKWHIVSNDREGGGYDELGRPTYSPDGSTLAYAAGLGSEKFVVINGKRQKVYASIGEPEFSPDSKRLVYLADLSADGPTLLVDSGKEGKHYEGIREQLYFNTSGQHLAMVAFTGEHQMVVVDGVEGNPYDMIITQGGGKVQFDDEERFHYLAVKKGELFLVEETIER